MLNDRDRRCGVCRENAKIKTRQSAQDKQERDRKRGRKHDERGETQAWRGVLYGRARTGSQCKHKARGKRNRKRDAVERTDTRLKRGNAEKMKDGERRRSNTNAARYHRDRNTGDGREK